LGAKEEIPGTEVLYSVVQLQGQSPGADWGQSPPEANDFW